MLAPIKRGLSASLFAAVALWSGGALACQLELDGIYTVSPFEDDGLSRAERVKCSLGELHFYDEKQGWRTMRDEGGEPLQVRDMAGVVTSSGELLVVILEDNQVAMRWGGPGSGAFFDASSENRAYYAQDATGERMMARGLGEVSWDPETDRVRVGIDSESAGHCEITSNDQLEFAWDWACDGGRHAAAATWSCRNDDLEISCSEEGCQASASHTPMDVTLDHEEISVCAYSGCWTGAPAAVTASGPFLTYSGVDLPFSTNPDDRRDVSITIETTSRVANILVAGQFANPAICQTR